MELELGLKITKSRDDFTSTTNFRMAKDPSGPIFISRETESKFILTAHLKGFGREHIGIKINEDGTQIAVSAERPVQEMVMSGWMMHKKEVELKGFIRVFRIPDGVILDRINAKFNEQESVLTILMPKSVKGIRRVGIEEVKEEEVVDKEREEPKKVRKVEESGQMLQKKADKERTKKETSAHRAKEKEIVGGKIKEPKIKNKHENRRAPGESSKKGDSTIGASKKVEEPKIAKKEETDLVDKGTVDEERSKRIQLVTDKLGQTEECDQKHDVKSSEETEQQKEKAIKAQKEEVDQATKQTFKEAATLEHKELNSEKKEFLEMKQQKTPEEKTNGFGAFELSDTKDGIEKVEDKVYEQSETTANSSGTLDRSDSKDGTMKVKDEVFEDLELREKSTKLEPDQPAEGHHAVEEARDREDSLRKEDEVEEEAPKKEKKENQDESPLVEEKKERSGEVSQEKKKASSSRKIKLCTPCVIAGSSIILSLVAFALHWIRSKKKETR